MHPMGIWLAWQRGRPVRVSRDGEARDLDDGIMYRSSWERNIARLMRFLNVQAAYEPVRFNFPGLSRQYSYLPDWKLRGVSVDVGERHYPTVFIELKGFYDLKSKRKIRNMAKYYGPKGIMVLVITEDIYKRIEDDYAEIVPHWERRRLNTYGNERGEQPEKHTDG